MPSVNRTLQAAVTKAATDAPFNGTELDISGIEGDVTIVVRVNSLTADKKAIFELQETVDNFTAHRVLETFHFTGGIDPSAPIRKTIRKYEIPMNRFGVTSAELRLSLIAADTGASINYEAWVEDHS